jgi:type II secretory pathway pseudopilin PulG
MKVNNSGFSIIQVIIAAGILGFLGLYVAQLQQNADKTIKSTELASEINMAHMKINSLLSDPATCDHNFAGQPPVNNYTELQKPDGSIIIEANSTTATFGNREIVIDTIQTMELSPVPQTGEVDLLITYRKNKKVTTYGGPTKLKRIRLSVTRSGGNIDSCSATAQTNPLASVCGTITDGFGNQFVWDGSECKAPIISVKDYPLAEVSHADESDSSETSSTSLGRNTDVHLCYLIQQHIENDEEGSEDADGEATCMVAKGSSRWYVRAHLNGKRINKVQCKAACLETTCIPTTPCASINLASTCSGTPVYDSCGTYCGVGTDTGCAPACSTSGDGCAIATDCCIGLICCSGTCQSHTSPCMGMPL